MGSSYFVSAEHALLQEFAATAILDMIGYKAPGPSNRITFVTNVQGDPFTVAALQSIQTYSLNLTPSEMVDSSFTSSDHSPFWVWGYPSMLAIEDLGSFNPAYHYANDTVDNLNETLMTETTRALLGALLAMNPPLITEVAEFQAPAIIAVLIGSVVVVLCYYAMKRRTRGDRPDR